MSGANATSGFGGWTLVLPVQHAERGKTRLVAPPGIARADLARAIATDAVTAAAGCSAVRRVVLVTSDPVVSGARPAGAPVQVLPDPGGGLTAAIEAGVRQARADGAWPVAVLLPDLPALRPADLDAALAAVADHALAVVPDLEGTGSVLLAAAAGHPLPHAFGAGSAQRHRALGAEVLALDLPRLRRDVDTLAALREAADLGLGPATRAVLGARWPADVLD